MRGIQYLFIFFSEAERDIYPEAFGDIPRALQRSGVTLTIIDHGAIVPNTVLGKILTIIITVTTIGIVAIPIGILAAVFPEALSEFKNRKDN